MAAEDVAMGRPALFYSVLEGMGDMFLSDNLGELLRTVLARENLVAHGGELRLYVMPGTA